MAITFNKWLCMALVPSFLSMTAITYKKNYLSDEVLLPVMEKKEADHPIHVSVTEVHHNAAEKTLEISCKIFTDDFEKVLAQNYRTKVDLINPPDRPGMEKLVNDFIQKHLTLKIDDKAVIPVYLGYERDNDAVYSYFEVQNIAAVKKVAITNQLMFDLFDDQINLMHITVGGKRKSVKLDYPEKEAVLGF